MPVLFRLEGGRFHFFSNGGDPRERVHIHVTRNGLDAKPWVSPAVEFAYNHGVDARMQRWISTVVEQRRSEIEDACHDHFS